MDALHQEVIVSPQGIGKYIISYIDILFTATFHVFLYRKRPYHNNMKHWRTRIMGVAGIDMSFVSFKRMALNVVN